MERAQGISWRLRGDPEKSAIIQRVAFQRINELRAEIAELKGGLVG